jgi:GH25 family lysozyme M1 (1,4-beta-N-acetylmuramidase)
MPLRPPLQSPRPLRLLFLAAAVSLAGCGAPPPDGEPLGTGEWPVHTVCGQSGSTVRGIDVSKWQGSINWPAVAKDNVRFAIARVSDGTGYIDGEFAANWKGIKANGIIRGAYQYFEPGQDATAQAKLFVDKINAAGGLDPEDLGGVIDVETMGGQSSATALKKVKEWIAYVESHTGKRPIIYTGSYFWDDHGLDASLASYPLWTAHYTSAACPLVPNPWKRWYFWQYSSTGSVSGISGNTDMDRFDGTLADLKDFVHKNNLVQPDAGVDAGKDAGKDAPAEASKDSATPKPDAAPGDSGPAHDSAAADAPNVDVAPTAADAGPDATTDATGEQTGSPPPSGAAPPASYFADNSAQESGCSCRVPRAGGPWSVWRLVAGAGLLALACRRRYF